MKKLLLILMLCSTLAYADNDVTSSGATDIDQNNQSGTNTSISGGYNSETSYAGGSTSTTNNTTNAYQGDSRVVNSANAPAMNNFSQDVCSIAMSGGISTFGLGISAGSSKRDENCERLKLAKLLDQLGMKVASVSLLCQDSRVFEAMAQSSTWCPINGKIGKEAELEWKKYGKLRPDYDVYIENLQYIEQVDQEIKELNEELFGEIIDEDTVKNINGDIYIPSK